jgi:hypothetical protein
MMARRWARRLQSESDDSRLESDRQERTLAAAAAGYSTLTIDLSAELIPKSEPPVFAPVPGLKRFGLGFGPEDRNRRSKHEVQRSNVRLEPRRARIDRAVGSRPRLASVQVPGHPH